MVTVLEVLAEEASTCTSCGLAVGRTNVVFGAGSSAADLMFVGGGPGAREAAQGVPAEVEVGRRSVHQGIHRARRNTFENLAINLDG